MSYAPDPGNHYAHRFRQILKGVLRDAKAEIPILASELGRFLIVALVALVCFVAWPLWPLAVLLLLAWIALK